MIRGGSHPSAVAGEATVEGGIGFLPDTPIEQVKRELRAAIEASPDAWLRSHFELRFDKLHNDAYEIPADHPLATTLAGAARESGLPGEVLGWNVSCDARLYAKRGGVPTVVFGPGDIRFAHSAQEQIELSEIRRAAEALVRFVMRWCA
jgi:acetylornithine deacetylase